MPKNQPLWSKFEGKKDCFWSKFEGKKDCFWSKFEDKKTVFGRNSRIKAFLTIINYLKILLNLSNNLSNIPSLTTL